MEPAFIVIIIFAGWNLWFISRYLMIRQKPRGQKVLLKIYGRLIMAFSLVIVFLIIWHYIL